MSCAFSPTIPEVPRQVATATTLKISSGFSFGDGQQVLVSVQKPLGVLLEEEDDGSIVVVDLMEDSSAGRAGVQLGDVLVAVQNADMSNQPLETVMGFIGQAPKVVNLRFERPH